MTDETRFNTRTEGRLNRLEAQVAELESRREPSAPAGEQMSHEENRLLLAVANRVVVSVVFQANPSYWESVQGRQLLAKVRAAILGEKA